MYSYEHVLACTHGRVFTNITTRCSCAFWRTCVIYIHIAVTAAAMSEATEHTYQRLGATTHSIRCYPIQIRRLGRNTGNTGYETARAGYTATPCHCRIVRILQTVYLVIYASVTGRPVQAFLSWPVPGRGQHK